MIWLQLAWRGLVREPRRSAFALGILVIGTVAALAAGGYVLATFTAVREAAIRGGAGHLQVALAAEFDGYEEHVLDNGLTPSDVERIRHVIGSTPRIDYALARLAFQGIVSSGERSLVTLAEGIEPAQERRLSTHHAALIAGEPLPSGPDANPYAALVGREMARLLGIGPGDSVTLLATAATGGLNAMDLEVTGILGTGSPELDRMRLFLPLATAQELLRTDRVRRIVAVLDDTAATAEVAASLERALGGFAVRTWEELVPFYGQLVGLYARQAAVLGVVIAAVVLLAVFCTVATGVLERRRELGILMSLGIPAGRVRRIFLLEGVLLGALGGACGTAAGLALCTVVNASRIMMPAAPGQTEPYPLYIAFEPRLAAATVGAMVLLGLLAAQAASRHVTRQRIVDALRRG